MRDHAIKETTYEKASLEDYQREILEIWPHLAERPALHTWARVVQHATTACEGMRRSDWSLVLKEIASTIVWWLAFIQKLNLLSKSSSCKTYEDDLVFGLPLSPTEIVWRKYPGVCPVEFGLAARNPATIAWKDRPGKVCRCLGRKREVEDRTPEEKIRAKRALRSFAQMNRRHRSNNVKGIEDMFRRIFEGVVYQLSVQEVCFHFIEEIGEVSEALANATVSECLNVRNSNKRTLVGERKEKLSGIAEELADVFSWSLAVVIKVQTLLMSFEKYVESRHESRQLQKIRSVLKWSQHISLAGIIWQKYGLKAGRLLCEDCNRRPCMCISQRAQPLYSQALNERQARMLLESSPEITMD